MNEHKHAADIADAARVLRGRVRCVLLQKAFLSSVIYVAPFAAVAVLAVRFTRCGFPLYLLALASAVAVAAVFAGMAIHAVRKLPSEKSCVAAIDSASSAGGLMMVNAASAGWDYPDIVVPEIKIEMGRQKQFAMCAFLILAVVFALPDSLFLHKDKSAVPVLAPIAEKELEKLEELSEEGLIDPETSSEMKEWLEKAAADDASSESMNELLESLDHIAEQLDSAEKDGVGAAVRESEALVAAENMADMLSEAMSAGCDENAISAAAEMMRDFIANSDISEAMKSNILANAFSGGLTAEELQNLSDAIASCSNISSNRIMKLCESGKLAESMCGNCCGSCTNSAAANLARLAENGNGCGKAAAACLECFPGNGAATRGPGSVELTFREAADASDVKFRDESLSPYYSPGENDTKLQRVIFTDPSKPGAAAPVKQGELKESGDSGGKTRHDAVLPRHRQAVDRYFDTK